VAALREVTEGWAAGLKLASLALRQRQSGGRPNLPLSGEQRFIADYLTEDVFERLPPEQQTFLLQTSVVDYLCAPLCDAVVESAGSQARLEALERDGLFLLPLDDRREWYRYHPLFAEYLQAALRRRLPEAVPDLHRRAAEWCLANNLPEAAFRHAVAAGEADLTARIVERYVSPKLLSGDYADLRRWLASLPEAWRARFPAFGFVEAGVLLFTGEFEAGARRVEAIAAQLDEVRAADTPKQHARVTAIRCFIACFQNDLPAAEGYGGEALRQLAPDDLAFRADIYHALGDTYRNHGQWETARDYYRRVLDLERAPAHEIRSVHIFGALADLELQQGRLRSAAAYWRRALAAFDAPETWGSFPLPLTGWVYIRFSEVLYEWNDLAAAEEHAARGLARAEVGGDVRALIAGCLSLGRIKLAAGDLDAAVAALERARPLVENADFPDWHSRFERLQLESWLAQGRFREASAWADAGIAGRQWVDRPESEPAQLAAARALLTSGEPPAVRRALQKLEVLRAAAEASGRLAIQIEALALLAIAAAARNDQAAALMALEHALRLAAPEGFIRLFVNLGLPLGRLLQTARGRQLMPEYVSRLLDAFGGAGPQKPSLLPEPLSARELDVLALLAAGLTNRQIGERLVISPETAKKHVASIFGKLGVNNRTQAAARARELRLFE
jgi:LuxR family maltose regulon positive regulatory protein